VRGNHDKRAGEPPPEWAIESIDGPLLIDGLALAHHPEPLPGHYVLAGHIHPAVLVGGRARDLLRLPCFHLGPRVGVLPAFGAFTGMHLMRRGAEDRVFVVAGDAVRALNSSS
jgi:metallophosphoesterase superfamily enzyme